jgi:hypothetical protein
MGEPEMEVQFRGTDDRSGVYHVSAKTDGTLVLRYGNSKEYVGPDEYSGFEIVPSQ